MQAIANRTNSTVDEAIQLMAKCAVEVWLRARNELPEWPHLSAARRTLLAEVIFSGFTMFGKRALQEAASIEPSVMKYYSHFQMWHLINKMPLQNGETAEPASIHDARGAPPIPLANALSELPEAQEPDSVLSQAVAAALQADSIAAPAGATNPMKAAEAAAAQPRSLRELYASIVRISANAIDEADIGPAPGRLIQSLLDEHLQRLAELNARLPAVEVKSLIEGYCRAVLAMTEVLDFVDSEQAEMVPILHAAWRLAVIDALESGNPPSWFQVSLAQRKHLPEFVERFEAERARIHAASREIEEIRGQMTVAKFTAKATLKAKETRSQNEISLAQRELETIRIETALLLLPEGKTLDELVDNPPDLGGVQIDVEGLDTAAVMALKALVTGLDKLQTRAEDLPRAAPQSMMSTIDAAARSQERGSQEPPFDPTVTAKTETETETEAEAHAPAEGATKVEVGQGAGVPTPTPQPEAEPIQAGAQAVVTATASPAQPTEPSASSQSHPAAEPVPWSLPQPEPELHPEIQIEQELHASAMTDELAPAVEGGVDQALRHLHWDESKEEAQQAFRIGYDQFSQVPSAVVEAVAMHWIESGHLNVAYQMLRDGNESTLLPGRVLDSSLVRAAFYGMNLWPKDVDALSHTQRELNLVNHRDLEEQLNRKPGGKLVPYLLVCATLQPALFAGRETQAPALLKEAANCFEGHLRQLIIITSDFTLRGGRVDLEMLRNEQGQEVHQAAARLQAEVTQWVDRNQMRTNKWHSLRVALKVSVTRPVIRDAIAAIKAGEQGDTAAIRHLVNTYSSHVECRRLLDELVIEIREDADIVEQIDSHAYTSFCQQMDQLMSIARAWQLEVTPVEMQAKDKKEFLQRFHTLLERAILNLESHPRHADLEHRAGAALLLKLLRSLGKQTKGERVATWSWGQTDATFRLPETLARLDMGDVGVDLRLEWFAMRLTSPSWLSDMLDVARRHQAHWVRLLLLRQLEEISGPRDVEIDNVSKDVANARSELSRVVDRFRDLSLQGMSIEEISETEHLVHVDLAKDWQDQLRQRKHYVDMSDIETEVQVRMRGMERLLNTSAQELEEELNAELLSIRVKIGQDAVPEGWDMRVRQALERRNLSVVRELVNQLKESKDRNSRLEETSLRENLELATFLKVHNTLYEILNQHLNPREAGDVVIEASPGGMDYSVQKATFRDAIGTMLEWRSKGQNKRSQLEQRTYESIVEVLEFLGFSIQNKVGTQEARNGCEYTLTGDFRRLKLRVHPRPILPKGFPLFAGDPGAAGLLNVIYVQGAWNLASLVELVERHGLCYGDVLLVGQPLSQEERRNFANFCRERKCSIFLLDPVLLSFLATARHGQASLEMFLRVSAAWTFYNPYIKGDARVPAPPEMRFGRETDIARLVEPRGAALVYGGRQLGKTTLLNAAVQEFNKRDPLHNRAFYMLMEKFQHVVERGTDIKKRLLEELVIKLVDAKVLPDSPQQAQIDAEDRLNAEFLRAGSTRVMFCLDEIDSVLNRDAATNFELVRSLKALVNDPHHRFRVVLAGLNNVNRFRTYPNVPLEQLGSPLEVGILSPQDARNLILQPLTALGYTFEEPELVDRIMAFTNRHPSLLHIFCSALVEQLGHDRLPKDGLRTIRQGDVEGIESNSSVRKLSGERFDMTLNLDKRYTVAVYGMVEKGLYKFTVIRALEVARALVPDEFEPMSESGFESLLEELVGLGVLRADNREKRQYAIRSQAILQLIGTPDDIRHKLQVAVRDLKTQKEDVLTCHATGPGREPSPLSLQDERMILSAKPPEGSPKFSVSVVMGTPALGVTLKTIQEGFNAINEFQSGSALSKYETRLVTDAGTMDLKRFGQMIDTGIETWAQLRPAVVLVSLEDSPSIDRIMDVIGIANEKAAGAMRLKNPLRIVFLLGARAMWSWHAHPWLTATPNEIGGQVELTRWTRHACECLLDQQGLGMTPEKADMLRQATEGWYASLMKFIEVRKKKPNAATFNDFDGVFTRLTELPSKDFDKFMIQTGMASLDWSMPLAGKIKECGALDEFSSEDLQSAIELLVDDHDYPIAPEQAGAVLRWWIALRVVDVNTKEKSRAAGKEDKITYSFLPSVKRAINEFVNQQDTSKEVTA